MYCTKSAAERNFVARSLASMSIYIVATAAVSWIFHHRHPQGVTAYMLALLPALPIFAVITALAIYLTEEKDEFVRTVLVQCSLWATALELAFVTCWGCLQIYFPSVNEKMPRANYWAFVVWWVAFAAVQPLVRWRYK